MVVILQRMTSCFRVSSRKEGSMWKGATFFFLNQRESFVPRILTPHRPELDPYGHPCSKRAGKVSGEAERRATVCPIMIHFPKPVHGLPKQTWYFMSQT
jgi:hypothetical protein